MTVWGALAGGFVGTLVLTTILRASSEMRPPPINTSAVHAAKSESGISIPFIASKNLFAPG